MSTLNTRQTLNTQTNIGSLFPTARKGSAAKPAAPAAPASTAALAEEFATEELNRNPGAVEDVLSDDAQSKKKERTPFAALQRLIKEGRQNARQANNSPAQQNQTQQQQPEKQVQKKELQQQQRATTGNQAQQNRVENSQRVGSFFTSLVKKNEKQTQAKTANFDRFMTAEDGEAPAKSILDLMDDAPATEKKPANKNTNGKGATSGSPAQGNKTGQSANVKIGAAFIDSPESEQVAQKQATGKARLNTNSTDGQLRLVDSFQKAGAAFPSILKKDDKKNTTSSSVFGFVNFGEEEADSFLPTYSFLRVRNFARSYEELNRRLGVTYLGGNGRWSGWTEAARLIQ